MKEKLIAFALTKIDLAFKLLRLFLPILRVKGLVVVARNSDVREVLDYPNVFGVTYAEKMGMITNGSNFFLGMNDTATYERDVSNMRITMPRSDVETLIQPMLNKKSQALFDTLPKEQDFNFCSEIAIKLPTYFSKEYLGVPGPSEEKIQEWATYMFWYLFFPEYPDEVTEKATQAASDIRPYIDGLISNTTTDQAADNVIQRCLKLQQADAAGMTNDDIRNNLIGMIIGLIPTTNKSATLVLDYLLDNPKILSQAQALARNDDDKGLAKLVLECLRFNAFSPGFFRIAMQDHRLAGGTLRAKTIRQGEKVMVLTQSAMMDGRAVKSPKKFSLDRPFCDYMPFGYGMHTCFGQYINLVQIPAILKPILKCQTVERAEGEKGKVKSNGPFPTDLYIRVTQ